MISFKILPEREDVKEYLLSAKDLFTSDDALSEIEELLFDCLDMALEDDGEIAVAVSAGCFLIRIYQDENGYSFMCPIPINEEASVIDAAEDIRKYAIKEEIPVVFIDGYEDDLSEVCEPFRFTEPEAMDEDGGTFCVTAYTEADCLEELPTIEGERAILSPLSEDDVLEYARLCRHPEVNKLYGNDYRDDYGTDAPDEEFFLRANSEFYRGTSITLAIRYEGKLAGEAAIFAFDYVGGAKIAIRLLPEFWGKGLGSDALHVMLELAREIDIKRLTTAVKKENTPSIAITGKYMNYKTDEGDTAIFEIAF